MDNHPDTAPKFYSPVTTLIITLGIFFGSQVIGGILLVVLGLARGWSFEQIDLWISESIWAQFLFFVFVAIATIKLVIEALNRSNLNIQNIGLNRPIPSHFLYALGGFVGYVIIFVASTIVISTLIPGIDINKKQALGFDTTTKGLALLPIFVSLVLIPPLIEEILARGFLYTGLRSKLPFITAGFITSMLFAAAHLGATNEGLLWIAGVDTFVLSMVMCFVREKTGSLWPSIGMHFIKNSIAFGVLFNIAQYFR